MRVALALAGLLGTTAGCQTFIGIDDAQQHLPRLDGKYVVGIERARPSNPATIDVIRMQGTATLDPDTRSLTLAMSILPFGGGTQLSETTFNGIDFPDDSDEVEYLIQFTVPAGALNPNPAPTAADSQFNSMVRFIAEADYSFCAKTLSAPPETLPQLGSLFVESFTSTPAMTDSSCDDPMRP
jgi:hypothetical protein